MKVKAAQGLARMGATLQASCTRTRLPTFFFSQTGGAALRGRTRLARREPPAASYESNTS